MFAFVQVTLLGRMFDQTVSPHVRGTVPQANLQDTILSAELEARFPDGQPSSGAQMLMDGWRRDPGAYSLTNLFFLLFFFVFVERPLGGCADA